MDLFGSAVLGLMLAGSAAPAWVGVLGVAAIVGSIVILTWQVRGWWERRGDELEVEVLPPSTTARPALFEETAVRDRSQPAHRHLSPGPRSRLVAHEADPEQTAQIPVPSVYGGGSEDETAVLYLNQPRGHRQ
jgi:hypothetical protein